MNNLTYKKMGRDISSLVLEASLPSRLLSDEEIRDEVILLNSQVNMETDDGWFIKNTNYNIGLVFNDIDTYDKLINAINIIKRYSDNRLEKRNGALLETPLYISFIITDNIGDIKREELKTLYESRVEYEAVLYDLNDSYDETYIRALNKAFRGDIFAYVLHVSTMGRQELEELELRYKLMFKDIQSKAVIHTDSRDELYVYEFALRNAMTYLQETTEDYDEIRDLIIQIAEDLKLQKEMIDLLIDNMPELHHVVDNTDDKAVTPKAVRDYVQDIITGNIDLPDNILTDENITHELGDEELKVISQKGFTEALNDVKSEVDINTQAIGLFDDKLEEIKDDVIDVKDDVELNKLDIGLNKESIKIIKEKDQEQDEELERLEGLIEDNVNSINAIDPKIEELKEKDISQDGKIKTIEETQVKHSSDITSLDNKIDDVEEKLQGDINTKFDIDSLHHKVDNTKTKPVTPKAVKEAIEGIVIPELPSGVLTDDSITNELGSSTSKVASQHLVSKEVRAINSAITIQEGRVEHIEELQKINSDVLENHKGEISQVKTDIKSLKIEQGVHKSRIDTLEDDINTKFDKGNLHHSIDLTDDKPVTPKAVKDAIDNIDLPEDILTQSDITNELGESEEKIASQNLVNSLDQDIKALDLITQDHDERLTKVENSTDIDVDDFIKFEDIHQRVDATTDKPISPDAVKRAIESITGGQPIPDNIITQDDVTSELGASTELVASQKLVSDINDKVEVNTSLITENENKINSLEVKQGELSDELSVIDTEHKQWISDIETEIETYKDAQNKRDIAQDGKIQSLEDDITSHSESISNLETKTADLESGLDDKVNRDEIHQLVDNTDDKPVSPKAVKRYVDSINIPNEDDFVNKDEFIEGKYTSAKDNEVITAEWSFREGFVLPTSAKTDAPIKSVDRTKLSDDTTAIPSSKAVKNEVDDRIIETQEYTDTVAVGLKNKITEVNNELDKKRDLSNNKFKGFMEVQAESDIGTGVFLICPDGEVRGQMAYNDYGLQFAQVQEDGTAQTFTFPRHGMGGEIALVEETPVDQIFVFESSTPPAGYIARNGQAIDKNTMPKLYARYGVNMPDDRDRVHRMTGTQAGTVGNTQEDAMQRIWGVFEYPNIGDGVSIINWAGGAFTHNSEAGSFGGIELEWWESDREGGEVVFDSSNAVRTANETRVKSRIVIFCNKIQ